MKVARRLAHDQKAATQASVEVSIVMPCLNEAETIARCIQKAQRAAERLGVSAEVIIADNGSTDGSAVIARELGARVVEVARKGYGAALIGGVEAASGELVVMGDADDSYDFGEIGPFIERLRAGDDLVVGNRFAGGIEPGAMPWLHRWLGNPVLSRITRTFFHAKVGDTHCGLRAFRKDAFERMHLRATGMEFASEMVVKASLKGMRISEVPVVLHPDGRSRRPHLRTWRDGWRHLRFMLLFSPRWLFLYPGLALFAAGVILSAALLPGPLRVGGVHLDVHTLLIAGFFCLLGYQLVLFAVFTKIFAMREGFHPPHPLLDRLLRRITLEAGLLAGALMSVVGVVALIAAVVSWQAAGFGNLDPSLTMREVIPAVVLLALGTQTVFASFFISILLIERQV
jgi:glycosyltransferase involved in cell wall biosynthesis